MQTRVSCLIGVCTRVGAEVEDGDKGAVKLKDKSYVMSEEARCKPHEKSYKKVGLFQKKTGNQKQQREQSASKPTRDSRFPFDIYGSRRTDYFYPKGKSAKQNTRASTTVAWCSKT